MNLTIINDTLLMINHCGQVLLINIIETCVSIARL